MLATTPNELLTSDNPEPVPEEFARQRAMAALAALCADDLERVAIMFEALAAERT